MFTLKQVMLALLTLNNIEENLDLALMAELSENMTSAATERGGRAQGRASE